jgi:hypothetical protein
VNLGPNLRVEFEWRMRYRAPYCLMCRPCLVGIEKFKPQRQPRTRSGRIETNGRVLDGLSISRAIIHGSNVRAVYVNSRRCVTKTEETGLFGRCLFDARGRADVADFCWSRIASQMMTGTACVC